MSRFILILFLIAFSLRSFAQEVISLDSISEGDLIKFSLVKIKTADFLEEKNKELKALILNDIRFEGGARFNQINAVWGNEGKMKIALVTSDEEIAYRQTLDLIDEMRRLVLEYKTDLIRNDSVLGIILYNKVIHAVRKDPGMKERVDLLIRSLREKQ